jgi:amidohydrolase
LRERVPAVIEASARVAGCRSEFELRPGYPATVNDAGAAEIVREVARRVAGEANVHETPPLTAAEDFAYFLRERPGAFILLGAGDRERGITAPHHSADFDIDESVLPLGTELLAGLALHSDLR